MRILIKIGGTLLDASESRACLAAQVAQIAGKHQVVVVHGGGKQMSRFLEQQGIESRFVNGLRVTTPDTIDAVLKVFAGSVNHGLVASLVAAGTNAVGLSGIDACLTEAVQMDPALGAVGRVVRSNAGILELLTKHAYLPVVACVAGDRQGNIYNVNADQMAVACAAGFQADQLLFLTDVEGVFDESKRLLPALTIEGCDQLIAAGVATGGMQAKLTAACSALRGGVAQVRILPGAAERVIERALSGQPIGTRVVTQEVIS